jgi:hypothetical protein
MSKTTSALADPTWQGQARLFFDRLPEHHRRWLAGLLSQLAGHGGDVFVADLLAVHEDTVRRGKRELRGGLGEYTPERVRRAGAGPKRLEELDPEVEVALRELVEPETAGDPCSSRRWTRRSLRNLAKALQAKGHKIGPDTVKRLLEKGGTHSKGTESASLGRRTPTGTSSSDT